MLITRMPQDIIMAVSIIVSSVPAEVSIIMIIIIIFAVPFQRVIHPRYTGTTLMK